MSYHAEGANELLTTVFRRPAQEPAYVMCRRNGAVIEVVRVALGPSRSAELAEARQLFAGFEAVES